jgi:hypothetical protein
VSVETSTAEAVTVVVRCDKGGCGEWWALALDWDYGRWGSADDAVPDARGLAAADGWGCAAVPAGGFSERRDAPDRCPAHKPKEAA